MKTKMLAAALTALALSAMFATAANAEEMPNANAQGMHEFAACGPFPPEEEAYLKDPHRTMQEIREHWEVNKVRYCATLLVPVAEANEAAFFISACLEPEMPHPTKAGAEACIADWQRSKGTQTQYMRRHARRHRHKMHRKSRRNAVASTALVGGLSAR
jgi:hypothetical protein